MIAVSEAWKERQDGLLAPEGFVEISYLLSHDGLQEEAVSSSTDAADFAATGKIVDISAHIGKYATLENNFWVLDGRADILGDEVPTDSGYVGASQDGTGSVQLRLATQHKETIPGVTITWADGYATEFTVAAKQAGRTVATKAIAGNTDQVSVVEFAMSNYDEVAITVHGWSLPGRRARIKVVQLGYQVVFTKDDITSFSHSQTVCLNSGELPKNSISFSLENSAGRWNPSNPDGVERYLSDRQKITVRYGFNVNGAVEWIKAGTFYLTEWKTPANGMEASFEARDVLEYMMDELYTGVKSGTLYEIVFSALGQVEFPYGTLFNIDPVLMNYAVDCSASKSDLTVAEILQYCANAACCVMYQDRDGVFNIVRSPRPASGVTIKSMMQYSYPEFSLFKPLRSVEVAGGAVSGDQALEASSNGTGTVSLGLSSSLNGDAVKYVLEVGSTGENQTVSNEFISTEEQAAEVAAWVAGNLQTRKSLSGEYRADPRLDVLDNISVETRFGTVQSVILTGLTYTFSGAFRGRFEGYVPVAGNVAIHYSGELWSGEVNG